MARCSICGSLLQDLDEFQKKKYKYTYYSLVCMDKRGCMERAILNRNSRIKMLENRIRELESDASKD